MPTIAVDAMGGEHAPDEIVKGVAQVSLATDIDCLLVGDEQRIQTVLETVSYNPEHIAILHCRDTIGMSEDAVEAMKRRDTSLLVGVRAVVEGRAEAFVSAGHAGASVLACTRHFTPLPGVRRATLSGAFARQPESPGQDPLALLLDTGATVHCAADELVQFAAMGSAWARRISKAPRPRVGLLNMAGEAGAGGETLSDAHQRLRRVPSLDFVGNVEGDELVRGKADVIVCEGLVGAVVLKLLEGVSDGFGDPGASATDRRLGWRMIRRATPGGDRLRALADYGSYGGAPIFGFAQLFLECHARSQAATFHNAVKVAAKAVRDRVPAEIADAVRGLR